MYGMQWECNTNGQGAGRGCMMTMRRFGRLISIRLVQKMPEKASFRNLRGFFQKNSIRFVFMSGEESDCVQTLD
jgi:hypothetical protein